MKKRNVRSLILGVCLFIIPGQIFCQFQKGIRADLGMSYLSEKVSLEAFYYHGLNNIKTRHTDRRHWEVRQGGIGLLYRLDDGK